MKSKQFYEIGEMVLDINLRHDLFVDGKGRVVSESGETLPYPIKNVEGFDVENISRMVTNKLVKEKLIDESFNDNETIQAAIADALSDILL